MPDPTAELSLHHQGVSAVISVRTVYYKLTSCLALTHTHLHSLRGVHYLFGMTFLVIFLEI